MRYPVMSRTRVEEIAAKRVSGVDVDIETDVEWVGSGDLLQLEAIERVADDVQAGFKLWTDKDVDQFEGKKAQPLYDVLVGLPIEVLDDRGFWRFLSIKYFWDFIAWRQREAFQPDGKYMPYIDAARNTETVLVRMFLRAAALGGVQTERLAGGIREAADFWRSHIVRIQTGSAPNVARAFAEQQYADRMTTNPVRAAAKRLTRTWTNVVLHVYDEEEARDVVEGIWRVP